MIFYLTPPRARIDLPNFNECCFSRFKFFLETAVKKHYETIDEKLIPGTKMDQIGHFLLRCFCAYNPAVKDFIIMQEIDLFFHRLRTLSLNDQRKSCRSILKQIPQLNNYKVFNPIKRRYETPYLGNLLWVALRTICETLLNHKIHRHLITDCNVDCHKYSEKVPFQMCLPIIRDRLVRLEHGFAVIPCSMWHLLLLELFRHHYEFGLSMIASTILPYLNNDMRWTLAFSQLSNTYESFKQPGPLISQKLLTAKQIDDEQQYFPPCMSHLLQVLRTHHRLSHNWRYNFSLFLKDIGLSVNESLEFWKTEYSKSCTAGTSCTHSWQANHRKYVYSIRHLYGLEGSRMKKKTKSCRTFQVMPLGMREEGGCPFVHFDDANLLASLSNEIAQDTKGVNEILKLKRMNDPLGACKAYRATLVQMRLRENLLEKLSSPVDYYRSLKKCSDSSLEW